MKTVKLYTEFFKGIWKENPVFVQVLGMCPTLAVTTKALFGMSMGCATTFVLVSTSIIVSIFRKLIPNQVRIATFTIIIATFVTIADLFLKAKFPLISKALGPYVPLIVVNCIILGRQEAFSSKHTVSRSLLDAIGMGIGFTLALIILGSIRELLGAGAIFGYRVAGESFANWVIMILPPGAFITLGVLVGIFNLISERIKRSK
jgi:electron transport complex protein RnfE